MRRRRTFIRRQFIRPVIVHPLEAESRQMLAHAHQLMDTGQCKEAAVIFDKLAQGTVTRGLSTAPPFLFIQSGRANILAGDIALGKMRLKQGLNQLAQNERWMALSETSKRLINELNNHGLTNIAQEISDWINTVLPVNAERLIANSIKDTQHKQKLPSKCPYCGGTIPPDEVEWQNEYTIQCLYCGSSVQVD